MIKTKTTRKTMCVFTNFVPDCTRNRDINKLVESSVCCSSDEIRLGDMI